MERRLTNSSVISIFSRLPFNWHTPFGYLIALFAQFPAVFAVLFCASTIFCFVVASSWLFITIIQDITNNLAELKCTEAFNSRNQSIKMQFCDIIGFYLDVKQLMGEFNRIHEFIITMGFFWSRLGNVRF